MTNVPAPLSDRPVQLVGTKGADVVVIDPRSGEMVTEEAPTEALVAARAALRLVDEEVADAKHVLDAWLVERMDQAASWSIRVGDYTASAPSPEPTWEWDAAGLYDELEAMVSEGLITRDAALAACRVDMTYKPIWAGIKAILKRRSLAPRIEKHGRKVAPERRRVSVRQTLRRS